MTTRRVEEDTVPLHYVDPHAPHSRRYTALVKFGRSRAAQFLARHVLFRVDPWLYRATGGRYPRVLGGTTSAPLTTTGAKSGQPRIRQVLYFHDGPDAILLASNSAQPHHPGWYYNLKANPECLLGDVRFLATEVADPVEYERLFTLAEWVYAGYGDYRVQAAKAGRRIPILRLTPH
ncbi:MULTISPECIES: nitroreductase/quinone reductase family protein [Mycolicibacterium]|uniref:Nitroreductase family deazaflavin-dependent oxidoreductase n=1 Tax=Mycolicibacterium mucogenicum TaxID=56689 RepID=A0A4R5W8R1_MYCMU|nr:MULTISPECIES: nitroreductase/quinone reductase family protein [Mycolicibacterium]TDK84521.1 nitroreductase family deazaflavin-dependent oxidoreductase [Mycolicibacterium mucogenicum]GCA97335.1 nitroreductase [Mycolicibacterium sp. NCC-Tsukiji]